MCGYQTKNLDEYGRAYRRETISQVEVGRCGRSVGLRCTEGQCKVLKP